MTTNQDTGQYTRHEIEKYEAIYGRNFISPGGLNITRQFVAGMGLQPGMHVLDVGCGLGGPAFYMAQNFAVTVQGLDLSQTMLQVAQERVAETRLRKRVRFEQGDILDFKPVTTYDRVHSRDAFLHVQQKQRLFQVLFDCLKPGGWLCFSDYCCSEGEKSTEFSAYIAQRQYTLHSVAEYRKCLAEAGFVDNIGQDRTNQFIEICEIEQNNLAASGLDAQTLDSLQASWQAKIKRAHAGEQRWGWFMAIKPEENEIARLRD